MDQTIYFLKELIEYKKERIEEIQIGNPKSWSDEVIENIEKDIYSIEALIEEREIHEEAVKSRKAHQKS